MMFVEDVLSQSCTDFLADSSMERLLQIILGEEMSLFLLPSFPHLALQLDFSELLGGDFCKRNFQGCWGQRCLSLVFRGECCTIANTLMFVVLDVLYKSNDIWFSEASWVQ